MIQIISIWHFGSTFANPLRSQLNLSFLCLQIVSNSIKSVIFIDEKALESYQKKSLTIIPEEELSINLNTEVVDAYGNIK